MLEKLFGLATIGSTFASVSLLHRFLSRLVIVLALTIISALFTGVLLIGVFYGIYRGLNYYGLDPDISLALVCLLLFSVTASLIALTISHLKSLRRLPTASSQTFPAVAHLGSITEAFLDGLLDRYRRPKD